MFWGSQTSDTNEARLLESRSDWKTLITEKSDHCLKIRIWILGIQSSPKIRTTLCLAWTCRQAFVASTQTLLCHNL